MDNYTDGRIRVCGQHQGQAREEEKKTKRDKAAAVNLCFDRKQSYNSLFCFGGPHAYYRKDCTLAD